MRRRDATAVDDRLERLLRRARPVSCSGAMRHLAASGSNPHRIACHRVFALVAEARGQKELAIGALERGLQLSREVESSSEIFRLQQELERVRAEYALHQPAPDAAR